MEHFVYEWRWVFAGVGFLWLLGGLITYSCGVVAGRADDAEEEMMRRWLRRR